MARTCITGAEASRIRGKAEDTLTASARTGIGDRVKDLSAPATTSAEDATRGFEPKTVSFTNRTTSVKELNLSAVETKAIREYTGDQYLPINAHLRKGSRRGGQGTISDVQSIDGVMARSRVEVDTIMFRGGRLPNAEVGMIFEDAGFVSTTTSRTIADTFITPRHPVQFTIHVPAGTRGIGVRKALTTIPKEAEIVLDRRLRYRVISVEDRAGSQLKRGFKITEVTVEVIQ